MSNDPFESMFAAIDDAERDALALHDAGRCGESEWSCSHCEAVAND